MSAQKCSWCAGSAFECAADATLVPCFQCDGGGYEPAAGDLGPTRSCPKGRPATYNPGTRTLSVRRGRKVTAYTLSEVTPDLTPEDRPFRVFEFKKEDGERHHCRVGEGWRDCDCRGSVSGSSARTERYEWYLPVSEHGPEYDTAGCVHLDAILWILSADLWDVDMPVGFDSNPSDPFGGEA
jgi:hypothetical protein